MCEIDSINERLFLVIDNFLLLAEHHGTYNFIGGSLDKKYMDNIIGTNSLKELKEELGIVIKKGYRKLKIISWFCDRKNCMRILFYLNIPRHAIIFKKASHVWESKSFTLININNSQEAENLGKFLESNIQKHNQPCISYIKITHDDQIMGIYKSDIDKNVFLDSQGNYYVKLVNKTNLTNQEIKLLKDVNLKLTGYHDAKDIYTKDYVCEFKYVALANNKNICFSISPNFIAKIREFIRNKKFPKINSSINYNDLLKLLCGNNICISIIDEDFINIFNKLEKCIYIDKR